MTPERIIRWDVTKCPQIPGAPSSHDAAFLRVIASCLELGGSAPAEAIARAREIRDGMDPLDYIPCQDLVREEL